MESSTRFDGRTFKVRLKMDVMRAAARPPRWRARSSVVSIQFSVPRICVRRTTLVCCVREVRAEWDKREMEWPNGVAGGGRRRFIIRFSMQSSSSSLTLIPDWYAGILDLDSHDELTQR
jgi:hypothetical protein